MSKVEKSVITPKWQKNIQNLTSYINLIIAQGGIKEVEALGTPELIETIDSKGETGIR